MKHVLILILSAWSVCLYSQKKKQRETSSFVEQPNRIEFTMNDATSNYHLISGKEDGILVVEEGEKLTGGEYPWTYYLADTTLTLIWTRVYSIPFEAQYVGYDYFEGKFYLLFNVSKYRSQDYMLQEIDLVTGAETRYDMNTVFPITMTEFEVIGENAIFGGYTNFRPVILTYNFLEKKPRVIPGFYENFTELQGLITDDDYQTFTTIQSDRLPNKRFTIRAKTFTSGGDLIQDNTIVQSDNKNLIDGTATSFFGGFQYIAGTFSKRSNDYSRGIYLCKFVNGRQHFIKYYEFADLTNFFGFMSAKREQRVKERIRKKKEKGRNPIFNYRLLVHDMIQHGDEFIMVAEAYYPRYSSYNSSPFATYARLSPTFLGYTYTHAMVVGFDRNGNLLWDHSFEIENADTYFLTEYVTVDVINDEIVLSYLKDHVINTKFVRGHEILEGKTYNPVKLTFDMDQVKSKNQGQEGMKNWFGHTMYAYGSQRISNDGSSPGQESRFVFYINKIQYHPEHAVN